MDCLSCDVEVIRLVSVDALLHQLIQTHHCPTVQRQHIGISHCIGIGVKIGNVAQNVPGGVANLQILIGQLLEDCIGAAHIHVIVRRCGPQTHQIGAVFGHDFIGVNAVAQRFVHGLALAVHGPAMGQHNVVGSSAAGCHSSQQRGLEPAAILVIALQIHGCRPAAGAVQLHRGHMGRAGVKPAVQRVGLFGEVLAAAVGADKSLGQQLFCLPIEPCVGAVLTENLGNLADGLIVAHGLAAIGAIEHGNGQTPTALTGDAPVGALTNHAHHAVMTPFGNPLHIVASLHSLFLECLHGAEPLVGGTEDDGALAAPAVGVGVDDVLAGQQRAAVHQILVNHRVCLLHGNACVLAGSLVKAAVITHVDNHVCAGFDFGILHADHKVICAVSRSGMHTAGTGIGGNVVAQNDQRGLVHQGVLCHHVLKLAAFHHSQLFRHGQSGFCQHGLHQLFCHDVHLAVGGFCHGVVHVGIQADCLVAGQGPSGGGPDDEVGVLQRTVLGELALVIDHGEFHENGGNGIVGVLDFCLSQSGLVMCAPINGLFALVDVTLFEHLAEHFDFFGLELGVHGQVGVIPIALTAQTFELLPLHINIVLCKLMAVVPEFGNAHCLVVQLLLFDNSRFDGHTVVIPAGGIGCMPAGHVFIADDKVLNALVQGGTHVNHTVGERRAVVQNKIVFSHVAVHHFVVEIHFLPCLQHIRLPFGQRGPHGEVRFRQIDCCIVILGHVHSPDFSIGYSM